jgi:hypothetical protein
LRRRSGLEGSLGILLDRVDAGGPKIELGLESLVDGHLSKPKDLATADGLAEVQSFRVAYGTETGSDAGGLQGGRFRPRREAPRDISRDHRRIRRWKTET